MIDNFVVHGTPAFWMGMTDQYGIGGIASSRVENGFEAACGSAKVIDGDNLRDIFVSHFYDFMRFS